MSAQNPQTPGHCAEEVAAYALGALEPTEAINFARHLESCRVCPDELAAFQTVVDEISAGVTRHPAPRELRRRVMRAVEDEPRLDVAARRERRPRRLRLPRPTFALPGAALAAAAVAVIVVVATGSGTSSHTYDATVTGTGTASMRVTGNRGQLVVHDFKAAPKGKIYEVWLQRGKTYQPTTALFGVTRDGDASVEVPASLKNVDAVLVTAEPTGGSKQPTTAPVIDAKLG